MALVRFLYIMLDTLSRNVPKDKDAMLHVSRCRSSSDWAYNCFLAQAVGFELGVVIRFSCAARRPGRRAITEDSASWALAKTNCAREAQ